MPKITATSAAILSAALGLYPILYFFHGQNVAILAHAITKEEAAVPAINVERAIARKLLFAQNPEVHTYVEEQDDGQD